MRPIELSARSQYFKACKDCEMRTGTCHSGCEKYAAEAILGIMLESEARKAAQKRSDEYAIREQKAKRISESCPGAKKAMRASGYIRKQGR